MRGHVRRRGNKYCFVIDIGRDPETGKRQQKWFSGYEGEKEAEVAMIAKIHEFNQGLYVEPSKISFKEFLSTWLTNYAQTNCAPRTFEEYQFIAMEHVSPELGNITMDNLKPMHFQNYYFKKLTKGRKDGTGGLSARSVLAHHRLIHQALEFAVKLQVLKVNPAKSATPPRSEKKEFNVLTKEDIYTLLEGAKGKYFYESVFLAITTGMRRGEIFALRWCDVDFSNQTFAIRQTIQRLKGKGLVIRKATKTHGSRRSIAVSNAVIEMLKVQLEKQAQHKQELGVYYQNHDLVMANKDGSPVNIDYVSREFGRLVKKLDIPHVRFHDLRHSHATLLLHQGEHPKIVSERLGHSTISITMDTYSHVTPNMQKEAAKKLDDFLFGN
ncbi:integrase [Croceifilum oryzae]|uniref:Integrase n=1 Tax=Croceifilum oryzae TaxID=1553429 RepID=A0AAJ1WUH0_9BACL|nr:tyrosine-type recombinase/integrase [Croceifilum oryzae]MDQ0417986.1 integrase [Croceifilum oryzae]